MLYYFYSQNMTMKYLALAVTTIFFSALLYVALSYVNWNYDISKWNCFSRLAFGILVWLPSYNHSKKFITI